MILTPSILFSRNSQNIDLLESYTNINPTGTGGATIAIVDKTAIGTGGEDTGAFVDAGNSGTGEISVYVVRKGDTLSGIADMFGVSVNTIIWANEIRGSKITEGQELVILPISGVRHVVKQGDTLKSIATKYKAELADILSYNNLSAGSKITVGNVIIVPAGEITSAIAGSRPASSSVSSGSNQIQVSLGAFLRPISGGKKSQGIHGYNAVDIAAPVGTPIIASMSGKVIVSRTGGYNGGYGTYVVVSHGNGVQTLYAHMNKNNVSVGQTIEQGETIGTVGMTGRTTGPHVHFEIRGAKNPF